MSWSGPTVTLRESIIRVHRLQEKHCLWYTWHPPSAGAQEKERKEEMERKEKERKEENRMKEEDLVLDRQFLRLIHSTGAADAALMKTRNYKKYLTFQ